MAPDRLASALRFWQFCGGHVYFGFGGLFLAEDIQANIGNAASADSQFLGCSDGEVDDPLGEENATVVDADYDGLAGVEIDDADQSTEGQAAVRGRHVIHIEGLAAGGLMAVEDGAVPGGYAEGGALQKRELLPAGLTLSLILSPGIDARKFLNWLF